MRCTNKKKLAALVVLSVLLTGCKSAAVSMEYELDSPVSAYRIDHTNSIADDKAEGFAADAAGALALLAATLLGLPASTTHTKTTAIMGAGAAQGSGGVDLRIVRDILWVWVLTFPGCGVLGFLTALLLTGGSG